MAKYNVHAGHCPDGFGAYGAIGLVKESTEARKVKDALIKMLKADGHTVYDCTCDDNVSSSQCLRRIVNKCNANTVDLDISIHLNAGRNDYKGNGSTGGSETLVYSTSSSSKGLADSITKSIAKELNIRNRGVKYRKDLYVLRRTKSPSVLIECCFVDDKDDIDRWDAKRCARAIYTALGGKATSADTRDTTKESKAKSTSVPASSTAVTVKDTWVSRVQKECNKQGLSKQKIDGIAGPITLAGCPTVRKGNRGTIVKLIQERVIALGSDCGSYGADGQFGSGTEKGVKDFQSKKNLVADGIVGKNTWTKLLGL